MSDRYEEFLARKAHVASLDGFAPLHVPSGLFDFQQYLLDWHTRAGRSAMFADCGLGKTFVTTRMG